MVGMGDKARMVSFFGVCLSEILACLQGVIFERNLP